MSLKIVLPSSLLAGIAILGFSTIAAASEPGIYIGGLLGWSQQNFGNPNLGNQIASTGIFFSPVTSISNSLSKNGLGGDIFIGYQFNDYIAGEFGGYYLNTAHASGSVTGYTPLPGFIGVQYGTVLANAKSQYEAIDLAAKFIWPATDNFDLHAKIGAAYAINKVSGNATAIFGSSAFTTTTYSQSNDRIVPLVGAGMSYDFTDNVSGDFDMSYLVKGGNVPNAYLVGVGLSYYFC
jgi:OOP family OmpA-OmpF porin